MNDESVANDEAVARAGERLRVARQDKGLSVNDVAAALKLPVRYVNALDAGDLSILPEATFVRGYAKAYARLVGLDPSSIVSAFAPVEVRVPKPLPDLGERQVVINSHRQPARIPTFRAEKTPYHWLAVGVLVMVVVGWFVWQSGQEDQPVMAGAPKAPAFAPLEKTPPVNGAKSLQTAEVSLPDVPQTEATIVADETAAAGSAAAPTGDGQSVAHETSVRAGETTHDAADIPDQGLYFAFRETSWVEVRDVDNAILLTRLVPSNTKLKLDGKPPLTITLGDASAVAIWYKGSPVAINRFSRAGVARVIVGQSTR